MDLIPIENIESRIYTVRGIKAMIDRDLAELYGVPTKALNQAVSRNPGRFPDDFMFRITEEEALLLRSQIVTANAERGGRRNLPYAFTEQGVSMLSSVLRSDRAIEVNIGIMRAFVKMREALIAFKDLAERIGKLETLGVEHSRILVEIVRFINAPPPDPPDPPKRRIGFDAQDRAKGDRPKGKRKK